MTLRLDRKLFAVADELVFGCLERKPLFETVVDAAVVLQGDSNPGHVEACFGPLAENGYTVNDEINRPDGSSARM